MLDKLGSLKRWEFLVVIFLVGLIFYTNNDVTAGSGSLAYGDTCRDSYGTLTACGSCLTCGASDKCVYIAAGSEDKAGTCNDASTGENSICNGAGVCIHCDKDGDNKWREGLDYDICGSDTCPNGRPLRDCNDNDVQINYCGGSRNGASPATYPNGVTGPTSTWHCDDGKDNDCDGSIDCADSDANSGGTCGNYCSCVNDANELIAQGTTVQCSTVAGKSYDSATVSGTATCTRNGQSQPYWTFDCTTECEQTTGNTCRSTCGNDQVSTVDDCSGDSGGAICCRPKSTCETNGGKCQGSCVSGQQQTGDSCAEAGSGLNCCQPACLVDSVYLNVGGVCDTNYQCSTISSCTGQKKEKLCNNDGDGTASCATSWGAWKTDTTDTGCVNTQCNPSSSTDPPLCNAGSGFACGGIWDCTSDGSGGQICESSITATKAATRSLNSGCDGTDLGTCLQCDASVTTASHKGIGVDASDDTTIYGQTPAGDCGNDQRDTGENVCGPTGYNSGKRYDKYERGQLCRTSYSSSNMCEYGGVMDYLNGQCDTTCGAVCDPSSTKFDCGVGASLGICTYQSSASVCSNSCTCNVANDLLTNHPECDATGHEIIYSCNTGVGGGWSGTQGACSTSCGGATSCGSAGWSVNPNTCQCEGPPAGTCSGLGGICGSACTNGDTNHGTQDCSVGDTCCECPAGYTYDSSAGVCDPPITTTGCSEASGAIGTCIDTSYCTGLDTSYGETDCGTGNECCICGNGRHLYNGQCITTPSCTSKQNGNAQCILDSNCDSENGPDFEYAGPFNPSCSGSNVCCGCGNGRSMINGICIDDEPTCGEKLLDFVDRRSGACIATNECDTGISPYHTTLSGTTCDDSGTNVCCRCATGWEFDITFGRCIPITEQFCDVEVRNTGSGRAVPGGNWPWHCTTSLLFSYPNDCFEYDLNGDPKRVCCIDRIDGIFEYYEWCDIT